jgi:acid stress-induced BolA-like protein IbaG/YrbA
MSKRDFQKEKLDSSDTAGYIDWNVALTEEKTNAQLNEKTGGESLEIIERKASKDLATARATTDRRRVLEGIDQKSDEEEQELAGCASMTSLFKMQDMLTTIQGKALTEREKMWTASNRIAKFVEETVELDIYRTFQKAGVLHPEDRLKQVMGGLANIKELMKVAVRDTASHFQKSIMMMQVMKDCDSMSKIEDLVDGLNEVKLKSSRHSTMWNEPNLVTDELVVSTLCACVVVDKGNDIAQEVHALVNKAKLSVVPVDWEAWSGEMVKIIKTLSINKDLRDKLRNGSGDGAAFKASAVSDAKDHKIQELQQQLAKAELASMKSNSSMAYNASVVSQQQYGQQQGGGMAQGQSGQGVMCSPWQAGLNLPTPIVFNASGWQQSAPGANNGSWNGISSDREVCINFRRGNCDRGSTCRFSHTANGAGGAGGQVQQQDQRKKGVCFNDGHCTRANCHFDHPSGKGGPATKERPGTPIGRKRK